MDSKLLQNSGQGSLDARIKLKIINHLVISKFAKEKTLLEMII